MKEVAECCFIQLYGEIVRSLFRQIEPKSGKISQVPEPNEVEQSRAMREDFLKKLEGLGFDVGYRFAERYAKDRPRMTMPLDVIKFICKEFWISVFKKQIDKLQTNHRGVFVLQDFSFRWLSSFSASTDESTREMALVYLVFPCGFIRGALTNLGITAIVNADVTSLPGCLFNIKIKD
ncbi:hypothetical protein ABG067_002720 [Albugo candida]